MTTSVPLRRRECRSKYAYDGTPELSAWSSHAGGPEWTRFTGYFRDSETQLDYAKNRYHQPGMGRFLTVDPNRGSARSADPRTWNRYAYTNGDPVNFVDPTGLDDDGFIAVCDPNDSGCDDNNGGWNYDYPCGVNDYSEVAGAGCVAAAAGSTAEETSSTCDSYYSSPNVFYTCFHQSGADWTHLTTDLKQVDARLQSDPECDKFLTSLGVTMTQIDSYLQNPNGTFTLAGTITEINPVGVLAGTTNDTGVPTPIIINSWVYQRASQYQDFLTILHELAHYVKVIPSDGAPALSQANDKTVIANCGKTLGSP